MSWEETFRRRQACHCGSGEVEEVGRSDDWGRLEVHRTILCEKCRDDFVWSPTVIGGHPGDETERGWVRRSVLAAEERYQNDVTRKLKALVGKRWRAMFAEGRTRKAKWEILTRDGRGYPSLATFYSHTKGMSVAELERYLDSFVEFGHLGRLVETFGIAAQDVDVRSDDQCPECGARLKRNARGQAMCYECKFIRWEPGF